MCVVFPKIYVRETLYREEKTLEWGNTMSLAMREIQGSVRVELVEIGFQQ